jgi:hypothetical protein
MAHAKIKLFSAGPVVPTIDARVGIADLHTHTARRSCTADTFSKTWINSPRKRFP